jgi:aminoglycoside phosphotransferase (APT) family kinase protein
MTAPNPIFDLDQLEKSDHLTRLIADQFGAQVVACEKIGEGFYAHVYRVDLRSDPDRLIVKCHRHPNRAAAEASQLRELRRHAVVRVPQVYSIHLRSDDLPCDAFTMEFIPGVNASTLEFPDERTRLRFVDAVIENLLAWHAVTHPEGFGPLDGPFHPTWVESLGPRIIAHRDALDDARHRSIYSPYVLSIIDRSCEAFDAIFANAGRRPSLVHSDYNAWNMMADPESFTLTGIIDPIDAGWSDPEIDLFHLPNARPDIGLLDRYLQEIELDAAFWMRYRFYRFWDDIKHYLRMGWYDEERFSTYARELEKSMDECLP